MPTLSLSWLPQDDRFGHRFSCSRLSDQSHLTVVSCEGSAGQDWPPSPVMQQIDDCRLHDGRQGKVGVGMAGSSHWSLAVEPRPGGWYFDVACRWKLSAGFLGSTYDLPPDWHPTTVSEREIRWLWQEASEQAELICAADPGQRLQFDPAQRRVIILPAADRVLSGPQTTRWAYLWSLKH